MHNQGIFRLFKPVNQGEFRTACLFPCNRISGSGYNAIQGSIISSLSTCKPGSYNSGSGSPFISVKIQKKCRIPSTKPPKNQQVYQQRINK